MKTTSKLIFGLAMAATALTSLAGMASAQEHEIVLSYNQIDIDVDNLGEFEGNGVTFESRGIYESGFRYHLSYTSVDIDALGDVEFGEIDIRYTPNTFGFAATYAGVGSGEDTFSVGAAAEYFVGDVEAYATLTSDVDNFLDDFTLEVGGRYDISENVTLIGEFKNEWVNNDTSTMAEVAARYKLVNNTFIQTGYAKVLNNNDADLDIYSLGLGINF